MSSPIFDDDDAASFSYHIPNYHIYAKRTMATAPTITAIALDGPLLTAAPVNGTAPVGLATTAELEPAATPGTPPTAGEPPTDGGLVAAACAGAGAPATRPTDGEEPEEPAGPVLKAT